MLLVPTAPISVCCFVRVTHFASWSWVSSIWQSYPLFMTPFPFHLTSWELQPLSLYSSQAHSLYYSLLQLEVFVLYSEFQIWILLVFIFFAMYVFTWTVYFFSLVGFATCINWCFNWRIYFTSRKLKMNKAIRKQVS